LRFPVELNSDDDLENEYDDDEQLHQVRRFCKSRPPAIELHRLIFKFSNFSFQQLAAACDVASMM
jgi:hypothetical protein